MKYFKEDKGLDSCYPGKVDGGYLGKRRKNT
jgi:hypothetical protein